MIYRPLILASASPQRAHLLHNLGIEVTVIPSAVDESACAETHPPRRAQTLARLKADDVAAKHPEAVVIGCDTLVEAASGALFEKPADEAEARSMLRRLRGTASTVHSAVHVRFGEQSAAGLSSSIVYFTSFTDDVIDWWIGTNLWRDRSGAFQIDGPGQLLIKRLEGDWTGVVGLPVFLLGGLLNRLGYSIMNYEV